MQYVINAADQIVWVSDEWDSFALNNNAPEAIGKNVIGRRYWEFVSGHQTISYLNSIFFACRMDMQPFRILYRCDSPEEKRLFRLVVQPGLNKMLTLKHQFLHSADKLPAKKVVNFSDRFDGNRCSICCAFQVGENWIDPFKYPDRKYFAKSYVVCPQCREDKRSALQVMKQSSDNASTILPEVDQLEE